MARAGYDPQDMVDFFELLNSEQALEPSKVEQFFSSHPSPEGRANRIRNEMKLLTVRETQPVGQLRRTQTTLAAMPAAKSMQQLATNQPAIPAPRAVSNTRYGDLRIEAPATSYRTFFERVLAPHLYVGMQFNASKVPEAWWPLGESRSVVVHPARSFGAPIVSRESIPTAVLWGAFKAKGTREFLARWFEVAQQSVSDAIEFEESLGI